MASVMAIESEVFGRCVGGIDELVGMENRGAWLCCGLIYLGFVLTCKVAQDWRHRWVMAPGIGGYFETLDVIE